MKVALDISAITSGTKNAHKVRGIGSYTQELSSSLKKFVPQCEIVGFRSPSEIPNDADVVHYPYFDPFSLSLPLVKKAKTIVTVHDFIPQLFPGHFPVGIRGFLRWQAQRALLKRMDALISVSQSTKQDCIAQTGMSKNKVHTVYSAASDVFAMALSSSEIAGVKRKYDLPDAFILYVGDATWNKNLPNLIRAVKQTGISLVLVGKALAQEFDRSNQWNRDLVEIEALTKDSSFRKLGYVPQRDLVGLYRLALMLAMPSLYEGFGFPILEAMMAGCPVVTSKRGAIPEVAGDAALFVDPERIESIGEGITCFAQSEKQRTLFIEKGKRQASKFSWKKTAEQTASIYETLSSK